MDKTLLEKASHSEQELYEVNEAIFDEIAIAANKLFEITVFPPSYKNFPLDIDFKSFVEGTRSFLESRAPFGMLWLIDFETLAYPSLTKAKVLPQIDFRSLPEVNRNIAIIRELFFSTKYNPPENVDEIGKHLAALKTVFQANKKMRSYYISIFLSLAFAKLLATVSKLETIAFMKSERELMRIKKTTMAKSNKVEKAKEFVLALYEHGEKIKTRTSFNKASSIIKRQFQYWRGKEGPWGTIPRDSKEMPTPSLDSIKRWLKKAGILHRDFIKEGRCWIKQT
jgi:hypothetical protein